jgi:hypothetical protein
LTFGACTTTQDKLHGNTALHWAILAQNHTAVSTLVMLGATLDITNAQVRTILFITQILIPPISQVSVHLFLALEATVVKSCLSRLMKGIR